MTRALHHSELTMNARLRSDLAALASLPRFERRLKLPPPLGRRFLYKYRPLDAAAHTDWLNDYLIESRLWLSTPSSFNDPFDMTCQVVFEGSSQEKRNRLIKLYQNRISKKDSARRDALVSEQMQKQDELLAGVSKTYEEHISKAGVFSMTKDPRSILMWSHYASNHGGVCLQFEAIEDVHIFTMAAPVTYSKVYPTINWADHTNAQIASTQIGQVLTCKYEDWLYEKEHRIIVPDAAAKYLSFSPSSLTGIIIGCQITKENEIKVRELLEARREKGHPPVKIYKAQRHSEKYKLCLSKVNI